MPASSQKHQVFYCEVAAAETVEIMKQVFGSQYHLWALPEDDTALEQKSFRRADLVLAGWRPVPGTSIREGKNVRLIYKLGAGIDKIDLEVAAQAGIPVAAAGGSNAAQVAEHTIMLLLAVLRRLPQAIEGLQAGRWEKNELRPRVRSLRGRTVGIVGLGRIGQALAQRLVAFETHLLYYDAYRPEQDVEQALQVTYRSLPALFAEADIITLHVPLTPETRGMITGDLLERLQPDAVFINTSRGTVVDQTALVQLLREGRILGAGLDVYEQEPLPSSDPLLSLDNVVLTPHIAGSARENIEGLARAARQSYERVLAGETPSGLVRAPGVA